ncbi:hypothetical protein HMPREF9552_01585, partial [Escherichia coli MS 198-1]|uniref:hypothetical protein n=1 Tax=Escherichia coli TaxID=562 RepID=UPI0001DBD006
GARGPTEPNSCCGENMEADDEEYSARSEPPFTLTPAIALKGLGGCISLFVAGVTIFAQYGPLAPLGRGLG